MGAFAGFAGAWLAQRGQVRLQREQRVHAEQVRWLGEKKPLYRDLTIALHGWHDSLVAIWKNEDGSDLAEHRTAAYKWSIEASLIANDDVRSALVKVQRSFMHDAQPIILRRPDERDGWPLKSVEDAMEELEAAFRAELASPRQLEAPRERTFRWGRQIPPESRRIERGAAAG
ncbi:hypothetical protein OG242_16215 [Streptomyces sp. NBC_00727]|uniref:hypothetical protein n=1 Tax=Streptomyces sp. NBC_00727 TaxID=2903675 RepID=UPI00386C0037